MSREIRRLSVLAACWWAVVVLIVGGSLSLIVLYAPQSDFRLPFWALFAVALVYGVHIGSIARHAQGTTHFLTRLHTNAATMTTPAPMPPSPSLALAPGERLVLQVRWPPLLLLRSLLVYPLRLLVATAGAELVFASLLGALSPGEGLIAGVPGWAQWGILVLPPLLWLLLSARYIVLIVQASEQKITVDDRGITRQRRLSTASFIPWQDITLCVRFLFSTGDQVTGSYLLAGQHHYLELAFLPHAVRIGKRPSNLYHYLPGESTYRALAERVLATILARSSVPLQVIGPKFYNPAPSRARSSPTLAQPTRTWLIGLAAQDLAGFPEAPPAYQPPAEALVWAKTYTGAYALPVTQEIEMWARTATLLAWRRGLVSGGLLVGLGIILLVVLQGDPLLASFLVFAVVLILAGVWYVSSAVKRLRSREAHIVAETTSLRQSGPGAALELPWEAIAAWGVIQPATDQEKPVYVILWQGVTLAWREDYAVTQPVAAGTFQQTYRDAANALHALIITRSGQAMKLIPRHALAS